LMPGSLPTSWAMSLNRPCHGKHSIAATWTTSWTTSWATSGTADFPTQTETSGISKTARPSVPGPTCRWRGIRWSHLDCGSGLAGGGEQNHAGEEGDKSLAVVLSWLDVEKLETPATDASSV